MNKITRRLSMMALPLALAGFAASPSQAQQLSLAQVSGYLNSFTTAESEFTQINADGTISTGTVYIKRPNRVRFEYNPPERSLVVAGGGQVAIFDPRSDGGADRYPLNQTPLKIILERNVDLTRTDMVTRHVSDGTTTTVTAQDPDRPELGNIQMVYTANPVELRQWIITDDTGQQTTVILGDLQTGGSVPDILFNIQREMRNWGN
ncbi:lipoprotein chaperone [Pseudooctadecabacter jejudonensis]|uniref:Lipoprotein chaperone n=2 Tax=Pseudooctadecabacter jejudonensis TaxID=1391910 RepID=A0A1Y5S9N4_9RHOB|nr:lipoprotein chaperone [Pseudooctadecabacter jejudonensis]